MHGVIVTVGSLCLLMVVAMLFYLGRESRYAFDQTFGYGYRFAVQPLKLPADYQLAMDPNASLITANPEGLDGLDDKEDGIMAPTLDMLAGTAGATATALRSDAADVDPNALFRDDWRSTKPAGTGDRFVLFAYGAPDAQGGKMALAWEPDSAYDPRLTPYSIRLRLVGAPEGVRAPEVDVDLRSEPYGRIDLPAWAPKTDAERTNGYVFRVDVEPSASQTGATLANAARTDWAPTLQYPRYGAAPLFLGTLLITVIALLFAVPVSFALAVLMSEVLPARAREIVKPVIELLASVPTVVLGYFGLMLVAPGLQGVLAGALAMESGRTLLTAGLVMGLLVVPTIATVAEDALRALPGGLREGAVALGLTTGEAIRKIITPAAKTGLIGAVLLGLARALGETMIVWMLSGGTPTMPSLASAGEAIGTLVKSSRGVPDTVAIEMGNVVFEGVHYGHLFLLGLALFLTTLAINLFGYWIGRRSAWRT